MSMLKALDLLLCLRPAAGPAPTAASTRLTRIRACASLTREVSNASESFSVSAPPTFSSVESFVTDVAKLALPRALSPLLSVLAARGETLVAPWERRAGVFPLAIPISECTAEEGKEAEIQQESSMVTTALLRWPTAPDGMDIPVVRVSKHGVTLLAKSPAELVHRLLVEAEYYDSALADAMFAAAGKVGEELHQRGDAVPGKLPSLEIYLMKQVGLFPDVFERLAMRHFQRGDTTSALVTAEYYASRKHFPGFGRPFVFNAEILADAGRGKESRDAARIALKSPWWTLGRSYSEVAAIAGWGDEQIEFMRERVTDEGRREDLLKGKANEQIAADQAAFLLDLTAVEGNWDSVRGQLADLYTQAGLMDMAKFVSGGS